MNSIDVTLDTCLLHALDAPQGSSILDARIQAVETVSHIVRLLKADKLQLLVDTDSEILNQYRTHLNNRQLAQTIITCAINYRRLLFESRKLTAKQTRKLDHIQFDKADRCFLNVAAPHGGLYATTEVKHLDPLQRRKVETICSVQTVSLEELLEICRSIS